MTRYIFALSFLFLFTFSNAQEKKRARDYGIEIGVMASGNLNAITDVPGVKVGHQTLIKGDSVRTGVTAILPHSGNIFQNKVPAAIYIGNGFGKLAGISQVQELGNLETPIILTNTLSVPMGIQGTVKYALALEGNENVQSVNAIVGETNDGYLNDIRGMHVSENDVIAAIENAKTGIVPEGNVGAGTGTVAFGFKGGIGTSSRKLPESLGGYTVGVLVQTNFGGVLTINGAPVGKELEQYPFSSAIKKSDGSCMIVVLTDAPLDARQLERVAKRAMMGLAKTGGIASNGSGDYVIAASTAESMRIPYQTREKFDTGDVLRNDHMSSIFMATIEATEEAIINSLFMAETSKGKGGHTIQQLPMEKVIPILQKYGVIK
ncbi:D-aminopeptidase [Roseivirga seohaensis subsp. aquiponti]|uniref:D-aminopeptidase n=1 Tax=Roseivirga seohaensis subsp. aquiponti TaxID=1566026 RepID=A0A0L8AGL1_9BACT|nr:P1 family peptidase [Roseivirga seohaensis]KOF01524.1 D-aminopeptidase [Roseivirga seohaensis subsp. aquiponti]